MRTLTAVLALLGCLGAGCIHTERRRLDEVVAFFHDDLRWNRMPAAEGAVDPRARAAFQRHHAGWGRAVTIMDMEMAHMQLRDGVGTVVTRISWTRGEDSTIVRDSVVEERWEHFEGDWHLRAERVISGDTGLFPPDPPARPRTARN